MDDPQDYLFMISYADPDGVEMQALANLITTNETYMFREYDQLQAFANYCLPEVLSAKQAAETGPCASGRRVARPAKKHTRWP